jgi:hypothetical protein
MKQLPVVDAERKNTKLWDFMFNYFPQAWFEVVRVAATGSQQHNPGEHMHWVRGKSPDQLNSAFRHIWDYGTGEEMDTDGCYHLAKAIWRLMAQLQLDIEEHGSEPATSNEDFRVLPQEIGRPSAPDSPLVF